MIITPFPLDTIVLPGDPNRSPGRHMSDLYNDFYKLKEPKRYGREGGPNPLHLAIGIAFEQALETALINILGPLLGGERPGEQSTRKGLLYTPDLVIFDPKTPIRLRGGEIKMTWMSCSECPISPEQAKPWGLKPTWDGKDTDVAFPPKFDKYFTQMMCYGYHMGTQYWRLYVCFVNGDYHPPRPVMLSWDFTFTDRQVIEEWQKIERHGKTRGLIK